MQNAKGTKKICSQLRHWIIAADNFYILDSSILSYGLTG